VLKLENPAPLAQPVTFGATLYLPHARATAVSIRLPNGELVRTTAGRAARTVAIHFLLPAGRSTLTIVTAPSTGGQHAKRVRLTNVVFSPTAYAPFLTGPLAGVPVQAPGQ
jgi:hypothetical protein